MSSRFSSPILVSSPSIFSPAPESSSSLLPSWTWPSKGDMILYACGQLRVDWKFGLACRTASTRPTWRGSMTQQTCAWNVLLFGYVRRFPDVRVLMGRDIASSDSRSVLEASSPGPRSTALPPSPAQLPHRRPPSSRLLPPSDRLPSGSGPAPAPPAGDQCAGTDHCDVQSLYPCAPAAAPLSSYWLSSSNVLLSSTGTARCSSLSNSWLQSCGGMCIAAGGCARRQEQARPHRDGAIPAAHPTTRPGVCLRSSP
mmetsp:Transcript_114138/g.323207  ORF Transcript_114138/g.323207 Transcript_114138/m.323207 type:complete len:255 (+) Transcript_114138:557-1321(+)